MEGRDREPPANAEADRAPEERAPEERAPEEGAAAETGSEADDLADEPALAAYGLDKVVDPARQDEPDDEMHYHDVEGGRGAMP